MWFEETSWSNLHLTELVEEWRDLWPSKVEFLVAAMSYVYAMTNFLNLPKLILDNGGLAFVSAYGAALVLCCLPTVVLEMAVGQVTGRAPVMAFYHLSPVFKGIGVSQILFTIVVLVCMSKFLSTLLVFFYYYFWTVHAGRPGLPWLNCKNFPEFLSFPCREAGSLANISHVAHNRLNTIQAESSLMQFITSFERPSESISEYGGFQLSILIAQGVIWGFVFVAICFGVRVLGKVVAFVLFISFASLFGFFLRSATLGGVTEILDVYWKATDWNRLADYQVWRLAVEQAILGCGIGYGAFITMSSYIKRSNNLVWDSIFLIIWHAIVSFLQTVTVICLVGYVAMKTGLHPSELLEKGESQMWYVLAYASYLPKMWSGVILAISICTLLSVFCLLALSVLSTLEDALGETWSRCFPRFILALFVAALCGGLSLYFATQAGRHAYELATGSIKHITLYVILAFEIFATAWLYCAHKLGNDLHAMMRSRCCSCLGHFFLFFTYLLPVIPVAIAVLNAMDYNFATFSPPIHVWKWSEWVGAAIAIGPLVPIPLYFWFTMLCACCCKGKSHQGKCNRVKSTFSTRLQPHQNRNEKPQPVPRYTNNAPGYLLLPQAPLAEPEIYA